MNLAVLLAEIDDELKNGFVHLSQRELLELELEFLRMSDLFDARTNEVLAAVSRREVHRSIKEVSPGMAVANRTRISSRRGARLHKRADVLVHLLPEIQEAYLAGKINVEQVDRIVRLSHDSRLLEALNRDQQMILGWVDRPFKEFNAMCDAWAELNDPTDPQLAADRAHSKRRLSFAKGLDGVTLLEADTPDDCAAVLKAAIEPIEDLLLKEDWAEARERLGDQATFSDLLRNRNQRRFDAFMQVIRQGAAIGNNDPGIAPIVRITMDYETFMRESARATGTEPSAPTESDITNFRCETHEGHRVSTGFAFDAAMSGEVRRVVINAKTRNVDISVKARLFTGLKREAIIIRDRWCTTPGCSTPASRCEADHIKRFSSGGLTRTADGEMKCGPCHRHKTRLETLGLWPQAA